MPPRASSFDPYRTFKFRVRFGEKVVAAVTKVSSLSRSVAANELKEGGDMTGPRHSPGAVTYEEITLERGLTLDSIFEDWANAVTKIHVDPSTKSFKRTVYIDVYDLTGNPADRASRPVVSYKLNRCWVSKYIALPELEASSGGVGIQSVTLRHEGWERMS
jgi:phage tail-like protein